MADGTAHAKAILIGEHFVLDGVPAIALSLPGMQTRVRWRDDGAALHLSQRLQAALGPAQAQTLSMLRLAAELAGAPARGEVDVRSSVPIGRGFGSSGALAVAALRAFGGGDWPAQKLLDAARQIEAVVHGHSSGLDPATAMADGAAIAFRNGAVQRRIAPQASPALQRARWLLTDVGEAPSTGAAIARARAARERLGPEATKALRDRVAAAAAQAERGLLDGAPEAIATAMRDNDAALRGLDVVDDRMARRIATLQALGALAAKQSGAGLGGLVLALAPDPAVATLLRDRLADDGATSWILEICP